MSSLSGQWVGQNGRFRTADVFEKVADVYIFIVHKLWLLEVIESGRCLLDSKAIPTRSYKPTDASIQTSAVLFNHRSFSTKPNGPYLMTYDNTWILGILISLIRVFEYRVSE